MPGDLLAVRQQRIPPFRLAKVANIEDRISSSERSNSYGEILLLRLVKPLPTKFKFVRLLIKGVL